MCLLHKENSHVFEGAPERIRTSDTRFRKPLLYPLSYEGGVWLSPSIELRRTPTA